MTAPCRWKCAVSVSLFVGLAVSACNAAQPHENAVKGRDRVYTREAPPLIVLPDRANLIEKEAAAELLEHLTLALDGAESAIVTEKDIRPATYTIYLGATKAAAKRNLSLDGVDAEGFRIKTVGNDLFILGRDNPNNKPTANGTYAERGTLNGVYTFLEKYVGVRWFFPGEHGRAVETRKELAIPDIDMTDSPYFKYRSLYGVHYRKTSSWGAGFNEDSTDIGIADSGVLWRWFLRMRYGGISNIPANHSTIHYKFYERFGKTRPEWFAMRKDGSRFISENDHQCFLNWGHPDVVEEHVRLALDHYSGANKILKYYPQAVGDYFVVMPNDSYLGDHSPESRKHIQWETNEDGRKYMNCSNLIFWHLNQVAKRVRDEYPRAILSICAYSCYRKPPSFALEPNIRVRLCIEGAYAHGRGKYEGDFWGAGQLELVKEWKRRSPRPLTIWAYQLAPLYRRDKLGMLVAHCPHAMSEFYKAVKPYTYGHFLENESEYFMREHLNRYVYFKLMWNPDLDIEGLLDDYFRNAYGPAAGHMKAFYGKWEELWGRICERGTKRWIPKEVWDQVLTPEALKDLGTAMGRAEKCAMTPAQRMRFAFVKKYLYDRVLEQRREYDSIYEGIRKTEIIARRAVRPVLDGALNEPFWQKAMAVGMHDIASPAEQVPAEIATTVRAAWNGRNLYLAFECQEPAPDRMQLRIRRNDEVAIWQDSGVEVFICPSLSREDVYYQVIINANGLCYDARCQRKDGKTTSDAAFDANARIKTTIGKTRWTAEMAIPFAAFGDARVGDDVRWRINFCRNRASGPMKAHHYSWSNVGREFHNADRFGRIAFYEE